MAKKPSRDQYDFHFHFDPDSGAIVPVEGGNQEQLSDFEFKLRQSLKEALDHVAKRKDDPLDRIEVSARMSRKLGREVSKTHLDQWTAMSTVQRRMPVDALKALCEVISDWRVMHCFVESCGFKALEPLEAKCAEFGAQFALKSLIDGKMKNIKADLEDPELIALLMKRVVKGASK